MDEEFKKEFREFWIQHNIDESRLEYPNNSRILLKMALSCIKQDKPLPEPLKGYFVTALEAVANGVDANIAFLLKRKQGRTEDDRLRDFDIAQIFRREKNNGATTDEIVEVLNAAGYVIKLREAQKIHREFKFYLDGMVEEGALPPYKKRTKK